MAELEKNQSNGQAIVLANVELKLGHLYYWEVRMATGRQGIFAGHSRALYVSRTAQVVVECGFAGIMLGIANPTVPLNTQLGSDSSGWAFTGGDAQCSSLCSSVM